MKIGLIIARTLASGLGSGFLPKAPGTWGTLVYAGILLFLSLTGLPVANGVANSEPKLSYPLVVIGITSTLAFCSTAFCLLHGRLERSLSAPVKNLQGSAELYVRDSVPEGADSDPFPPKHTKGIDPQWIVIDEWAGLSITTLVAPYSLGSGADIALTVAAISLFRLFDVTKPFGVREAEKLPGALGVVTDDIVAGTYATLLLWLVRFFCW